MKKKIVNSENRKRAEKVWKWLVFFLTVPCLLLFAVFLLVHSYLEKIDYQSEVVAEMVNETVDITEEDEWENTIWEENGESAVGEDSDEDEIAALEEQLRRQVLEDGEMLFDEDVLNILLIGCDTRVKDERGRSDTNILVSINRDQKEITLTSVMRDSYVAIPEHSNNRINAAYAYGGARLLLETVRTNFRIQVDKYVAVDFYSFMDIIDALGGLDIEVTDAEVKVMNQYIESLNRMKKREEDTDQIKSGGMLHLNGIQALAYARVRYVGNADFDRTQRQRVIVTKVFEKAKKMNLLELNEILNMLLPEVKTNMSEGEIFSLLLHAADYLQYELNLLRLPVDGSYEAMRIRGMAVLGVDLEKNRMAFEEMVYHQ